MITMMNFGVRFKIFWLQFCHINESDFYVIFLLELSDTQANELLFVFKEIKYLFLFIAIRTALL